RCPTGSAPAGPPVICAAQGLLLIANHGSDLAGPPVRQRDSVVVRVGDVESAYPGADAARLTERCGSGRAVRSACGPAPQPGGHGALPRVQPFDLVVVAVCQVKKPRSEE